MRGEDIFLSTKEARRVYVMEQVLEGKLTIKLAAEHLNLSERQVKRLKKGMREKGVAALMHGNRGRTPKHAIPKDIKDVVASLAQGLYKDASAQHMSELLAEKQAVNISSKSVRRILKERGIPNPHSCKQPRRCRKSRDRAPKLGMLVQMDSSPFEWIEDRGPKFDLHGAIDDATGKVLGLHFRPNEDLRGYLEVLSYMATRFGIPRALYTDGHTIFFSPKKDKLTIEEELAGKQVALTQLGRVIDELGIIHIHARSPQAKGRVERLWDTLQSRLKVEMRIAGVSTIEEANAFLPGFIEKFNARFAVEPADLEPAFLPAVANQDLKAIICVKENRQAKGSVISYYGRKYRLADQKGNIVSLPPRAKIEVLLHLDNSIEAMFQGNRYSLCQFQPAPSPKVEAAPVVETPRNRKPNSNNPWLNFKIPPKNNDPVEQYFQKRNWRLSLIHQQHQDN